MKLKKTIFTLGTLGCSMSLFGFFVGCGDSGTSVSGPQTTSLARSTVVSDAAVEVPKPVSDALPVEQVRKQASDEGKYLLVFVWKANDESTRSHRQVFEEALLELGEQAIATDVLVSAENQREFVNEFGLARAPLPLVLAIAPGGAITGGFSSPFSKSQLLGGIVSPKTQEMLGHLQNGKLVFVCVQNDETPNADEVHTTIDAFKVFEGLSAKVATVSINPNEATEKDLLSDLKVESTSVATTVLLAPPGMAIARFEGKFTQQEVSEALAQASSGGCAAGQCGPGAQCGP